MKKGFTLIELLVVIAIIAILAAIIFPVFSRARLSAYKSSDITSMNSIRTALQLYRADQGAYPPSLLGYIGNYQGSGQAVIPANLLSGALYPKRVDSLEVLRPALDKPTSGNFNSQVSYASWPNNPGGTDGSSQRYGPTDGAVISCYDSTNDVSGPNGYYAVSGYDAAEVPCAGTGSPGCYVDPTAIPPVAATVGTTGLRNEIHYSLFWSRYSVALDPCRPGAGDGTDGIGSASDDPRQLGYSDPPDTTVITWDSYFRDPLTGGAVPKVKSDVVLFLGGSARPYDSNAVSTLSWKVMP
jgi:prepilin-type N-terminal cleavage/methylation domain-containing protein